MMRSRQPPKGPMSLRSRGTRMTVLLVLVVVVAGFTFPGDDRGLVEPPPCNCPHLAEAVDSINWAPGFHLGTSEGWRVADGLLVQRSFRGAGADPAQLLDRIRQGMVDTGFVLVDDEDERVEFSLRGLNIEASVGGLPRDIIAVRVLYDGEDLPEVANLVKPLHAALQDK